MLSPRFRVPASIQNSLEGVEWDRPLDVHASLMKKENFEGARSKKYVVAGSYLYYHYMQDSFNDNVSIVL